MVVLLALASAIFVVFCGLGACSRPTNPASGSISRDQAMVSAAGDAHAGTVGLSSGTLNVEKNVSLDQPDGVVGNPQKSANVNVLDTLDQVDGVVRHPHKPDTLVEAKMRLDKSSPHPPAFFEANTVLEMTSVTAGRSGLILSGNSSGLHNSAAAQEVQAATSAETNTTTRTTFSNCACNLMDWDFLLHNSLFRGLSGCESVHVDSSSYDEEEVMRFGAEVFPLGRGFGGNLIREVPKVVFRFPDMTKCADLNGGEVIIGLKRIRPTMLTASAEPATRARATPANLLATATNYCRTDEKNYRAAKIGKDSEGNEVTAQPVKKNPNFEYCVCQSTENDGLADCRTGTGHGYNTAEMLNLGLPKERYYPAIEAHPGVLWFFNFLWQGPFSCQRYNGYDLAILMGYNSPGTSNVGSSTVIYTPTSSSDDSYSFESDTDSSSKSFSVKSTEIADSSDAWGSEDSPDCV